MAASPMQFLSADESTYTPKVKTESASFIAIKRVFTTPGVVVKATVKWRKLDVEIKEDGVVVFVQKDVEAPESWSDNAVRIVVSRYFRGQFGTPERETSVWQVIRRVVQRLATWARESGYFGEQEDFSRGEDEALERLEAFRDELTYALLHQYVAFNSPVWFNLGWDSRKQVASACFILDVEDTMESILNHYVVEGSLFKDGSGSGANLSKLRSSQEGLSAGGKASGPVSFMRGYDAGAGAIRSGGSTRRAAKIAILNDDHPDIFEFVQCKAKEEKAAHTLVAGGYSANFTEKGNAYEYVAFQNANHSMSASDAFMRAVERGLPWELHEVTTGKVAKTVRAMELFDEVAKAAHVCGDPGLQFRDTMNRWHTCPQDGEITGTNPCSEYIFLHDTACNLASLNLVKFLRADGSFDVEKYKHVVELTITAQEILVTPAEYPTPAIAEATRRFRTLGLGPTNLGALLMMKGLAYDSDEGRTFSAALVSLMTATAYRQSARLAAVAGPFDAYAANKEPMQRVLDQHRRAADALLRQGVANSETEDLLLAGCDAWGDATRAVLCHGARSAQVTVAAPCGTIAFMMDCDTTGIEPDLALVKYKKLVGGGTLAMPNQSVPRALSTLGYTAAERDAILEHVKAKSDIAGAPSFKPEHLSVFDCALAAPESGRSIHWSGHVNMLAALQPFLSGGMSKTVNLPAETTVDEIKQIYLQAWKSGLKCIALYRDGCKASQPHTAAVKAQPTVAAIAAPVAAHAPVVRAPVRRKLPDERPSITHKFSVGGQEGYFTVGLYDDGAPGEIFLCVSKAGSTIAGLCDVVAVLISTALQYGAPLEALVERLRSTRFEPAGFTTNAQIRSAHSIVDYIARWLELKFLKKTPVVDHAPVSVAPELLVKTNGASADGPPCTACGAITRRTGACYGCPSCGATSGCS